MVPAVKNTPAHAGDTGSIPGPGATSVPQLLSPKLLSPSLEPMLHDREEPPLPATQESLNRAMKTQCSQKSMRKSSFF